MVESIRAIRSTAIRNQRKVGAALSAIIKSEAQSEREDRAAQSLLMIHRTLSDIATLLSECNQVSESAAQRLAYFIGLLGYRVEQIESMLNRGLGM